jgi:SHS family lactate transporter-like MFS transporter
VGAFLFGLLADRYGRRLPLMIDLVFYSVCEVLTGLAPNYTTFLVLRALFGIGMGGEWGVGASLAMEKVPPGCAACSPDCCSKATPPAIFWLPSPFSSCSSVGAGGRFSSSAELPALLALFVRFRVKESEVWQKSREESLGRAGARHRIALEAFLYLTLLMTMMNFVSHGTQDMYPTFLERQWHFGPSQRSVITGISMIGAILGGIVMGRLSDRYGRRRVMIGALLGGILMVPLWAYSPSTALLVLGAFLIQFMVQGAWGIIPAHLSELSPDSVRGFMPGFSYQCGVLVASSVVYIEAVLPRTMSYATAMALTAATVFALAAIVRGQARNEKGMCSAAAHERFALPGRFPAACLRMPVQHPAPNRLVRRAGAFRGIVFADPVGVQVRRQTQHANVLESELLERAISGTDVGTLPHRTAAAIDHQVGIFRQFCHSSLQRFNSFGLRRRTGIDGMHDVLAAIQHRKRHRQDDGSLARLNRLREQRGRRPGIRLLTPAAQCNNRKQRAAAKTLCLLFMVHKETFERLSCTRTALAEATTPSPSAYRARSSDWFAYRLAPENAWPGRVGSRIPEL